MDVYTLSEDNVRAALNDFNHLLKVIEHHPRKRDLGSKIRKGAREILTYLWTGGLLPTLTYYLAKSEENTLKNIKNVFNKEKREQLFENLDKLAYAIILYFTLKRLKETNIISSELDNPRKCLIELLNSSYLKRVYALHLITSYLLEFKKLCEATFEAER